MIKRMSTAAGFMACPMQRLPSVALKDCAETEKRPSSRAHSSRHEGAQNLDDRPSDGVSAINPVPRHLGDHHCVRKSQRSALVRLTPPEALTNMTAGHGNRPLATSVGQALPHPSSRIRARRASMGYAMDQFHTLDLASFIWCSLRGWQAAEQRAVFQPWVSRCF